MGLIFCQSLLVLIAMTAPAYAYLDPGAATMMLQLVLGAVAGGLVILKLYWARARAFFKRGRARLADTPASQSAVGADREERSD